MTVFGDVTSIVVELKPGVIVAPPAPVGTVPLP